jgi:hypothetical protein
MDEKKELTTEQKLNVNQELLKAFEYEIYRLVIQKKVCERFPEDEKEKQIVLNIKKELEKLEIKLNVVNEFIAVLEKKSKIPNVENDGQKLND